MKVQDAQTIEAQIAYQINMVNDLIKMASRHGLTVNVSSHDSPSGSIRPIRAA